MAIKAARPLFKRKAKYVAIRPTKIKGEVVQPGEDVDLRQHHLRSLYQRRRIGIKGHPWTEAVLETKGFPKSIISEDPPAPEVKYDEATGFEEGFIHEVEDGDGWTYEGTEEVFETKEAAVEAAKAEVEAVLDDDEPIVDPDPEAETNAESNSNEDDVTNEEDEDKEPDEDEEESEEEDEDDESWDD